MIKPIKTKPSFIIYDSRYTYDPDSAIVMEACDTLKEAREELKTFGGAVIVNSETGLIVE